MDEKVGAAVQPLGAHQLLACLQAAIAAGDAQLARGEGVELTPDLWEEIDREADEAERRGVPLNPDVCPESGCRKGWPDAKAVLATRAR